ncbi:hypothetical protein JW979_15785 [bacterium]|nr:hypothetical protein [candidate division CSSED10-310 bacterium]
MNGIEIISFIKDPSLIKDPTILKSNCLEFQLLPGEYRLTFPVFSTSMPIVTDDDPGDFRKKGKEISYYGFDISVEFVERSFYAKPGYCYYLHVIDIETFRYDPKGSLAWFFGWTTKENLVTFFQWTKYDVRITGGPGFWGSGFKGVDVTSEPMRDDLIWIETNIGCRCEFNWPEKYIFLENLEKKGKSRILLINTGNGN